MAVRPNFDGLADKELLRRAIKAHDEHKLMVAGRCIEILDARGSTLAVSQAVGVAWEKVEAIRRVHMRVLVLRRSLGSDDGWEVQRDSDGIRCLYQSHESGFVKLRLEAEVASPKVIDPFRGPPRPPDAGWIDCN